VWGVPEERLGRHDHQRLPEVAPHLPTSRAFSEEPYLMCGAILAHITSCVRRFGLKEVAPHLLTSRAVLGRKVNVRLPGKGN